MRPFGVVVALCLCAVSCGPGKFSSEGQTKTAGVFRYPLINSPTTLDPHKVQDGDTIDLLQQVYEGLVGWSTESKPVGLLAESWVVSDDGRTYTFTLRSNAKFHNGRQVTADDVKWSFERCASPKIASPVSDAYFSDIEGFTDKFTGKAQEVSGVKVVDPAHVAITLNAPSRMFLGKLTYISSCVVPKESFPADAEVTDLKDMIGSGPFKYASYQPDQLVVIDGFADYHSGAPKLKSIERLILKDAVTRLNKYKSGEVDLVQLERQDVEGLMKDDKYKGQFKFFDRPAIYYVAMNQLEYPPFKDKRIRQAFAMAFDREKIVREQLGGINVVAYSIVPPGVPGGDRKDAKSYKFNVTEAKRLLTSAGFPEGRGLQTLTLTYRDEKPDLRLVAEAVAREIKMNLGVEVKLQPMEWGAYLEKYNAKKQVFYHMRWAADYLDPQNFLSHMLATWGPENKMGYSSPAFDALCRQADAEPDMDKALAIYAQAEDLVLQDAPWIPVYYQKDAELISTRVSGLRESIFGHLPHTTTTVR